MTATPPNVNVYTGQPWDASQSHVRVYLNGREMSCQFIDSLQVSGGRNRRRGVPDPATLAATWIGDFGMEPQIGDRIQVAAAAPDGTPHWQRHYGIPIFDGLVTDVGLDWEPNGTVHVDLNGADHMAALAGVAVGDTPWPAENISQRFRHVWDAAAAAIGTANLPEAWPPAGDYPDVRPTFHPYLLDRDVDAQPALDLIHGIMRAAKRVFTFWPHRAPLFSQNPTPWAMHFDVDDTSRWRPEYQTLWDLQPFKPYRASVVPCQIVAADPPPHWTINQEGYANVVTVRYGEEPATGGPRPQAVSRHAPVAPTTRDQAWNIDTRLRDQADADTLAQDWRERLQTMRPLLSATVVYTADTLTAADDAYSGNQPHLNSDNARIDYLMGLMLGGASIVAHPIDIGYRQLTFMERWYVESKTIAWRPDGWQVELVASDQHTYVPSTGDAAWQADWSW